MSEPSTTSQEPVSQAEFARIIGVSRQHVSQLKKAGRLVMDGARVVVDASRASIKQSEDQRRDDVRLRHAEERAETPPMPLTPEAVEVVRRRAEAIMRKEEATAEIKQMESASMAGELIPVAIVNRAAMDMGATIRAKLEQLPDQLSPQLTAMADREEIHSLLAEHIEFVLNELSAKVAAMGSVP